jgi:hypothetical protein
MKKLIILTVLLTPLFSNIRAQKIKKKFLVIKYLSVPSDTSTFDKRYTWTWNDNIIENYNQTPNNTINNNYTKGLTLQAGKHPDYLSKLRNLPGFKGAKHEDLNYEEKSSTFCKLDINTQPIQFIKKEIIAKSIKSSEGKVTGTNYKYKITVSVSKNITLFKNKTDIIYKDGDNGSETYTYLFPDDIKKKSPSQAKLYGYPSKSALNNKFTALYNSFMNEVREDILSKWIKKSYDNIGSIYDENNISYNFEASYIKFKKGKGYPESEAIFDKIILIRDKINENRKAKNKKNWHTPEIQNLARECEKELSLIIEKEKNTPTISEENLLWIKKNSLFLQFILGNFENTVSKAEEINQLDNKIVEKLYLDDFISVVKDYQIRFNVNAKNYNWID